jgi:hypothetical protein
MVSRMSSPVTTAIRTSGKPASCVSLRSTAAAALGLAAPKLPTMAMLLLMQVARMGVTNSASSGS